METMRSKKITVRLAVVIAMVFILCFFATAFAHAASAPRATALVKPRGGTYLRKSYSSSSKAVVKLKKNKKIQLIREVSVDPKKTSSKYRWYYVKAGKKHGYIRGDKIKKVRYARKTMQTTDALNIRTAPSTQAKVKGVFSKGSSVSVVLPASLKKDKNWYKIKKGSKYYYVCSLYVTTPAPKAKTSTKTSTKVTTTVVAAPKTFKASYVATSGKVSSKEITPGITVKGLTYPVKIGKGLPFSLRGTIESEDPITKVKAGVVNSAGRWVITFKDTPNTTKYNLGSKADSEIKFGTLGTGKYVYKVQATISGKTRTIAKYSFRVYKRKGSDVLKKKAVSLAWPAGSAPSDYTRPKGAATPEYVAALATAFGGKKAPAGGASCDVFVCTVCRSTGYDTNMPAGVTSQWSYLASSPNFTRVSYSYSESDLQPGDIIIYKRKNAGWHVCMYVGNGNIAEASYTKKRYGFINTSLSKVLKRDKSKIAVYRTTY